MMLPTISMNGWLNAEGSTRGFFFLSQVAIDVILKSMCRKNIRQTERFGRGGNMYHAKGATIGYWEPGACRN